MNDWFDTIIKILLIVVFAIAIISIPVGIYLEIKIVGMAQTGESLPWWAVWLLLSK